MGRAPSCPLPHPAQVGASPQGRVPYGGSRGPIGADQCRRHPAPLHPAWDQGLGGPSRGAFPLPFPSLSSRAAAAAAADWTDNKTASPSSVCLCLARACPGPHPVPSLSHDAALLIASRPSFVLAGFGDTKAPTTNSHTPHPLAPTPVVLARARPQPSTHTHTHRHTHTHAPRSSMASMRGPWQARGRHALTSATSRALLKPPPPPTSPPVLMRQLRRLRNASTTPARTRPKTAIFFPGGSPPVTPVRGSPTTLY